MISRRTVSLGFAFTFALAALGAALSAPSQMSAPVRNFEFTYLTRIPTSPPGAKTLKIWIPLPQSDPYQAIGGMQIESPSPTRSVAIRNTATSTSIFKFRLKS